MEVEPNESKCPEGDEPRVSENVAKKMDEATKVVNNEKSNVTENAEKETDAETPVENNGKLNVTKNSEKDEAIPVENNEKMNETEKVEKQTDKAIPVENNAKMNVTEKVEKQTDEAIPVENNEKMNETEKMEKQKDEAIPVENNENMNETEKVEKQTDEAISVENIKKSDVIEVREEKDEKKAESAAEKINQESFKKPTLLIGPRRGKVGQLRTAPSLNTKEGTKPSDLSHGAFSQPEKSCADDNSENDPESEKAKGTVCKKQQMPLPYKEPSWGGPPSSEYKIEVLKSGVILHTIDIHEKSYYVIGRLPTCDISLAHPTISRYHAILQYRAVEDEKRSKGFFLYDLGSTHGTFWNGCRVWPNTYVKIQGGHMIRFGGSQRKFILQAPPEDTEEESELTVTELKEKRRLDLLERERMEREQKEKEEETERLRLEKEEQDGISWGMGEDADEETDLTVNPYALTNNEELFLDDPKKTLRGWFEREGHDLQYETEEKGVGQFLCWVDLPLDTATGRPVRAEALVKGKKKEAVIQCALEACRILDRHGVLRQATHEARKRKARNWEEEDFYDSDEDNYLDRTGTVEKKREQRMRQAGKLEEKVETYASLLEKHTAVTKKIDDIENRLKKSESLKEASKDNTNEDALDAFMSSLNSTILNKAEVTKMKLELQSLRKEEERLLKLVNITKPANLPSLTPQKNSDDIPKPEETTISKDNASRKRKSNVDSNSEAVKRPLSVVKESRCKETIQENNSKTKESRIDDSEAVNSKESNPSVQDRVASVDALGIENPAIVENPLATVEESKETNADEMEKSESEIVKKKKKNMRRMQQRAEKAAAKETHKGYEDDAYSEDYSMWLPPVNQSGDGKTNLNDKYGY